AGWNHRGLGVAAADTVSGGLRSPVPQITGGERESAVRRGRARRLPPLAGGGPAVGRGLAARWSLALALIGPGLMVMLADTECR
ncbi:MAG TPA: hypothetical protein VMW49_04905, partial [Candidatus Dormibacteraeota bacterium]|nr:hypothetical protein [Candidatus Dormibacteraeota bacterium]